MSPDPGGGGPGGGGPGDGPTRRWLSLGTVLGAATLVALALSGLPDGDTMGTASAPGPTGTSARGSEAASAGTAPARTQGGAAAVRPPGAAPGIPPGTGAGTPTGTSRRTSPTVVPAAVDPGQQETVRDHWDPAAMTVAVPAAPVVVLAPAPPPAPSTTSSSTSAGAGPSDAPGGQVDAGTVWSGTGLLARTSGKVFFTSGGVDHSCSGSAVDSPDGSTVLTAAHCVLDGTGHASRWAFVPGYDAGRAPFGVFAATHFGVLDGFAAGDTSQDVAFVNVGRNDAGQTLGEAVGGQPVSFGDATGGRVDALGYPQPSPFDGNRLVHCAGPASPDPRDARQLGLACTMTAGSSGGPWLADLDPATGRGRLVSVTSFSYSDQPGVVYGPVLGPEAQHLFDLVSSDPDA